ncbi:MAG: alpha-amylase family glycosyl hydrolase, partial [Arcanobacterium sp.]|nr:alpha-amylase family glycosyl hydrolase [Arcanobacterium sp.]
MRRSLTHSFRWAATAITGALAIVLTALVPLPALAAPVSVIVTGDFLQAAQIGCSNWAEQCAGTEMDPNPEKPSVYEKKIVVPAGSWEYKILADRTWHSNIGTNMALTVAAPTAVTFQFDTTSGHVGVKLDGIDRPYSPVNDASLIAAPAHSGTGENFYFVLTDRFANGDPSNDTAGLGSDPMVSGFDPSNKGFYNGGDIAGLRQKLDYIQNLGTTALWLTPSFTNKPVQGTGASASAGYHGYWVTDFTTIDPHLGGNAELRALIDEAHARNIKVYFDIIVNHTADLIQFVQTGDSGTVPYRSIADTPYKDANGREFDIVQKALSPDFPPLNKNSFPYTPQRVGPILPESLSDVTLYHNRGNGTWKDGSEDFTFGDFDTLDDLMTENPKVLDAMTNIYSTWKDFGIDGFRIDTMKHVNFKFWQEWSKRIAAHNAAAHPNFFMFGEVYNFDVQDLAPYSRATQVNATLDFAWQNSAVAYLNGGSAANLDGLYAADDYYTTPHSSAGDQPTFLGNHDMGRVGYLLNAGADKLRRSQLGHELMFLTRGQPVVYYGDEQGFVGTGSDKNARQSLFKTQVPDYANQPLITGEIAGAVDRYSTSAPLYRTISAVAKVRASNPALKTGAQIALHADNGPGVLAFARVDRTEKREYVVAANNTGADKQVTFATLTPGAIYQPVYGAAAPVAATGTITLTVPAFHAIALKADRPLPAAENFGVTLTPENGAPASAARRSLNGQPTVSFENVAVSAKVPEHRWAETSFSWRVVGEQQWHALGTATGDKPRVFHDVAGLKPGTLVEYRAVSVDAA